ESKQMFYSNLRWRGYPADKLALWFQEVNYKARISVLQRAGTKRQERDIPLLIPSEYNLVWNYVDLKRVFETMTDTWKQHGVDTSCLQGPLIKSLRRTENFADKFSVWNIELLK
ncbi:hypothetical protein EX30DRAFT_287839, partial [Ascodesmis nigricans]